MLILLQDFANNLLHLLNILIVGYEEINIQMPVVPETGIDNLSVHDRVVRNENHLAGVATSIFLEESTIVVIQWAAGP